MFSVNIRAETSLTFQAVGQIEQGRWTSERKQLILSLPAVIQSYHTSSVLKSSPHIYHPCRQKKSPLLQPHPLFPLPEASVIGSEICRTCMERKEEFKNNEPKC